MNSTATAIRAASLWRWKDRTEQKRCTYLPRSCLGLQAYSRYSTHSIAQLDVTFIVDQRAKMGSCSKIKDENET
jgi:hypothetical protein